MNNDYPDSEPDGLGDLKAIRRSPGMQKVAPPINWGEEYANMSLAEKLDRAQKVASAMNHAADILQKERNELVKICQAQELKIKQASSARIVHGASIAQELSSSALEKQELYKEIIQLKKELKTLKKQLKAVEDGS